MKIINLLLVLAVVTLSSFVEKTEQDYLYLNSDQLNSLGLNLTKKGLFYKNLNPSWTKEDGKYAGLMFHCSKKNYLSTISFKESESKDLNYKQRSLKKMKMTHNDFYPVLIGDAEGNMSFENKELAAGIKLLPVAIKLSETSKKRKDIVVVWFRPTESLKQVLPKDININDYLRFRNY